ncbi:hypothetical protein [Emticicia agri]|uniref:hypothetical protein n=1 Tax=Emticicia agri TaxID=2492393 RepID=UPI0013E9F69C|nr:hypothetical protein [Emticicia agri]
MQKITFFDIETKTEYYMVIESVISYQMQHYRFGDKRLNKRCFFANLNYLRQIVA